MHKTPRHNAKARQSAAGSSHKKGKTRHKTDSSATEPADTNAEVLEHKSTEDKELDRKERMKQELLAQMESKASGKKRKRLDKYIEKKLKKEERLELFEKLSKSQAELPNTLHLYSSSTLGAGKISTNQDRLDKQEDKEIRRVVDGRLGSRRKRADRFAGVAGSESDASDLGDEDTSMVPEHDEDEQEGKSKATPIVIVDSTTTVYMKPEPNAPPATVGSALQRNADGSVVTPRILKRKEKGKRTILQKWKRGAPEPQLPTAEDSDDSFDSSDSANDSDENDDPESMGSGSEEEGPNGAESGSEQEGEASSEDNEQQQQQPARKGAGFKQWAMSQLSAVKGYIAPAPADPATELKEPTPPPRKKRRLETTLPSEMRGPLGEDLSLPTTVLADHLQSAGNSGTRPAKKVVSVSRPLDVQETRLLLPIVAEEQPIMEAILLNSVVIICGETGSGKTTQVPQFLYEAGFGSPGSDNPGMIGITQPRRVAAMSMASRVAHELSVSASRVSYQIRYDATVSPSTSIKFMTDGVLLRELATDFLLTKYSVIIIDEAHERSMNTDILIGVLSRVVKLRESMWKEGKDGTKPLRLIIMSATLRVSDFAENTTLFAAPPPIISVPARQHPVTVHFNRRTVSDYVTEAIRKTSKIHSRLPPGGILIFLTGQNEITGVCRKLEERYGAKALEARSRRRKTTQARTDAQNFFKDEKDIINVKPAQADVEAEDMDLGQGQDDDLALDVDDDKADAAAHADADMDALDTDDEEANDQALGIDAEESDVPLHIVPLYSLLPSEKQMKVFQPPPPGSRLVVVATNVAETSLTIPGIRYVVDAGRAKERRYNVSNGIQSFQISWVSKASASQRAGRAGRTGPGHCYRLYSSAIFENHFEQFSQPEILRMPIEGVVLQMKSMHIDAVVNFPFPTPPDRATLRQAETVLVHLGALSTTSIGAKNDAGLRPSLIGGNITDLGRTMSLFPLSPRFSKMLVSGRQHGCLPYVIAIVSAMSVGDPFLREEALAGDEPSDSEDDEDLSHLTSEKVRAKEVLRSRRRAFFQSQQLHASLGKSASDLFRILSVVGAYEYAGGGQAFCAEHFVRPKAMEEIHKLRAQISNIVRTNFPDTDPGFTQNLPPPSELQLKVLRQLLASSFIDQVAARKELVVKDAASGNQYTTTKGVPYRALGISEDVFIHPSSVLASTTPPDYVVFSEVVRTNRVWLKGLTVVNPAWLSSLGKASLCSFSKPFKNNIGELMIMPKFGPEGWELPLVKAAN
ncbi:P-loop containing nucleoside triphosphate hydrolase protein [Artomyces pyxidatus]|uniref:P-loop containing nucleoside triphosphate hydrolase protein n=1 Tax=Artomyces pyxidatus TaxID=48021 RepID=A0ACB8SZ17_9AGAM|nr:P-loop containing nucleoside triphosphate hydrolase protein [Artomyces pyxidatus]